MSCVYDLVVFSHLRWDYVYQRPQHLMSRLAHGRRVIFVEEPLFCAEELPFWERKYPIPGVMVCRLRTPIASPGFHRDHGEVFGSLLKQLLAAEGVSRYVCWFYTPLALQLVRSLEPMAVVYDCMDELSSFLHAPAALRACEEELLRCADLVFTGGPSLYRAKCECHPAVFCFPSSVDVAHFRQGGNGLGDAEDQVDLPRPRLGFFGVIDERIDYELLATLAQSHPEWQVVMVGPVAKVDRTKLPRFANLHYVGQRAYACLPAYLAGWDVCLLPFAQNGATRFISPTKTLEYMAAERLIVSTPIQDVVEPYGEIVYVGHTAEDFVAACEAALGASGDERARRVGLMRMVLARTSWDGVASEMIGLIDGVVRSGV